jgi:3-hydroxypropanoate dehydrogenase
VNTTSALNADALDRIFREARSANTFTDEPVPKAKLEEIFELAKFGPTAINAQPLRIVFVRSGEGRERLLKHMNDGNRDKTASAPVAAILAYDIDFHDRLPEVFPHNPDLKHAFGDVERREQMASFNAALQAGYFIIAVRAAGLDAGPMGGFDRVGLDEDFFADSSLRSFLVVNVGHAGEKAWFERLPRLTYDDVVSHA